MSAGTLVRCACGHGKAEHVHDAGACWHGHRFDGTDSGEACTCRRFIEHPDICPRCVRMDCTPEGFQYEPGWGVDGPGVATLRCRCVCHVTHQPEEHDDGVV